MFKVIFLPLTGLVCSLFYLINLYKRRKGFLNEDDFYDNTVAFKGWAIGIIVFIASLIYLVKGIYSYPSQTARMCTTVDSTI